MALVLLAPTAAGANADAGGDARADAAARKSTFDSMQPATRLLQQDDTQNPAMLWVQDGTTLWTTRDSADTKSCADCHGDIAAMRGVATQYPKYSAPAKRVVNLSQQINQCRATKQHARAWPSENAALLGLEAAIALQSRGQKIAPPSAAQPQLVEAQKRGEALFNQRIGQTNLSCRDCHDGLAGKRLGGSPIPQGHPTGYPIYRLEWQSLGSLQRRLRGCMTAVRAEPYPYGTTELLDLESYLAKRATGMPLETPAVRP